MVAPLIVQSCTLPSEQQPLRIAEFEALFSDAVRNVVRVSPTRLRLYLDACAETRARELAARENQCCSFFLFEFDSTATGFVLMDIAVSPKEAGVLDALAARAADRQLPRDDRREASCAIPSKE